MAEGIQASLRFPDSFVHLGAASAVPLEVNETFWPDLASGKFADLGPGRLVSFYEFEGDWDSWEIHPAGEELVCLFSGSADLILEQPDGNVAVELWGPGAFAVVPRGTWHTVRAHERSKALFVTAGEGTEQRPA